MSDVLAQSTSLLQANHQKQGEVAQLQQLRQRLAQLQRQWRKPA